MMAGFDPVGLGVVVVGGISLSRLISLIQFLDLAGSLALVVLTVVASTVVVVCRYFSTESLILAQDERWRRA